MDSIQDHKAELGWSRDINRNLKGEKGELLLLSVGNNGEPKRENPSFRNRKRRKYAFSPVFFNTLIFVCSMSSKLK